MDNLIHSGEAKPVIVVITNGNPNQKSVLHVAPASGQNSLRTVPRNFPVDPAQKRIQYTSAVRKRQLPLLLPAKTFQFTLISKLYDKKSPIYLNLHYI